MVEARQKKWELYRKNTQYCISTDKVWQNRNPQTTQHLQITQWQTNVIPTTFIGCSLNGHTKCYLSTQQLMLTNSSHYPSEWQTNNHTGGHLICVQSHMGLQCILALMCTHADSVDWELCRTRVLNWISGPHEAAMTGRAEVEHATAQRLA